MSSGKGDHLHAIPAPAAAVPPPGSPGFPGSPAQCILLLPPQSDLPLPAPLLHALQRRGLAPRLAADLPSALVDIALTPTLALIVIAPAAWSRWRELIPVLNQYFPSILHWQYHPASSSISKLDLAPLPAPASPPPAVPTPAIPAAKPARVLSAPRFPEPLLTREELDMLLDTTLPRRRPRPDEEDDEV